jgi:anti-anti-sigma factor
MNLDIAIDRRAGATTLAPRGPLDGATAAELQEPLLAAIAENPPAVVLDCADVPYVSSAGLRVLVVATKELKARNQRLRLINVPEAVLQVLKMANFTSFIDVA